MGATLSANAARIPRWGLPPWTIDFHSEQLAVPDEVDFAIVGGGFTGLAAAAWLRHLEPNKRVALFEASRIGAGSSGHTGGMTLADTAAGELPGLGDVLAGFSNILQELQVHCDLTLAGALEIGREGILPNSPISWNDSGRLGVTREVPGGTIDPGKMLSGLAQAARKGGALIFENAPVESLTFDELPVLTIQGQPARALRAAVDKRGISGTKRPRRPGAAEIHAGGNNGAAVGRTDFIARTRVGKAVLHCRSAVFMGARFSAQPRDFRKRFGAFGRLARVADTQRDGRSSSGASRRPRKTRARFTSFAERCAIEPSLGRTHSDRGQVGASIPPAHAPSRCDRARGVQRTRRSAFGVFGRVGGGGDARKKELAAMGGERQRCRFER